MVGTSEIRCSSYRSLTLPPRRNWTEIMRVIVSLQMTSTKKLATPSDWVPGEKAVILPSEQRESERRHNNEFFS